MKSTRPLRTSGPKGVLLFTLACLIGCADQPDATYPAPNDAAYFDIIEANGSLHLLYGRDRESADQVATEFYHALSTDNGATWSLPVKIPTGHANPGRHHRGNDPQLAVQGDHVMAIWTARGTGPWGSGPLAMALSKDRGKTWQPGPPPGHNADATAEIGARFPAIAADRDGLHAIWIHAEGSERSLRHAVMNLADLTWSAPSIIDPHICACCWNRLEITDDGRLVALYRDQDPSDMALSVSADRGRTWEAKGHVGRFDWDFPGCPHVGGGLTLLPGPDRQTLFASVWSGHQNHTGAYAMRSENLGRSWQPEPPNGDVFRAGRNTDILALTDGRLIIAWDQAAEKGSRTIFYAISNDRGLTWGTPQAVSTTGAVAAHPRLVTASGGALLLWSEEIRDTASMEMISIGQAE